MNYFVELRLVGKTELLKILGRGKLETALKIMHINFLHQRKRLLKRLEEKLLPFNLILMKKFIETLYNIYKIEELRERVILTPWDVIGLSSWCSNCIARN